MMYRRYNRWNDPNNNSFYNYAEIDARFASTGTCVHSIAKGDRIGWHASLKKTQCAACWSRWVMENAEADALERGYV